eukprot:5653104-Pleurochrysis_carterae.AAC.3
MNVSYVFEHEDGAVRSRAATGFDEIATDGFEYAVCDAQQLCSHSIADGGVARVRIGVRNRLVAVGAHVQERRSGEGRAG